MNVVDILVSIVVVTILVTIILAVVTYAAYKLRLSREPARAEDDPSALRYFTPYEPPERGEGDDAASASAVAGDGSAAGEGGDGGADAVDDSAPGRLEQDVAELEGHATQT